MSQAKARKPRKTKAEPTVAAKPIELTWELAELPSSQHRAGLAGLVLMVQFLRRRAFEGTCEIARCDAFGATLRVDGAGMQSLFDDVYAASLEEQYVKAQWKDSKKQNIPPKREEDVEVSQTNKKGETIVKKERRFVYDQVIPGGAFLAQIEGADASGRQPWLKLFRDMVWGILRGVPAQRAPFNQRARRELVHDGHEAFGALADERDASVELPSTYFLGAQAHTSDQIPFEDRRRYQFLLHFWPYAARIYVPAVENSKGERDFVGFAIAVPDVADLATFVTEWERSLAERDGALQGYRPRQSVIDVPGEAGVDLFARVCVPLAGQEARSRTSDLVIGVDVFHCEREGNNIRLRSVARVRADDTMVSEYMRTKSAYWSVPFRAQRIRNVLDRKPWWHGYERMMTTTAYERTIGNSYFRRDAQEAFGGVEVEMNEEEPATIESLVYRTVGMYLSGRMSSKYGLEWEKVQHDEGRKKEWNEKRGKLAKDAFLAVRARTAADFVTYFASTLCSVPQRLDEIRYQLLATELAQHPEKLRTLTLLALSARG